MSESRKRRSGKRGKYIFNYILLIYVLLSGLKKTLNEFYCQIFLEQAFNFFISGSVKIMRSNSSTDAELVIPEPPTLFALSELSGAPLCVASPSTPEKTIKTVTKETYDTTMFPVHKTSTVTSPLTPEYAMSSIKTSTSAESVSGIAGSKRKTGSDEMPSCSKQLF